MKFKSYFVTALMFFKNLFTPYCCNIKLFFLFLLFSAFFNIEKVEFSSNLHAAFPSIPGCSSLTDETVLSSSELPGSNCYMLCNALPSTILPQPGRNCLIRNMPTCEGANTSHRVNCYDPIDLPLCSLVADPSQRRNLSNCILECSDPSFTSSNPSNHNVNCIRFCSPTVTSDCVSRKCHQHDPHTSLTSSCSSMDRCDRLWSIEHDSWSRFMATQTDPNADPSAVDSRFASESPPKYCDNLFSHSPTTPLKCYHLDADSLSSINITNYNSPCITHNCIPSADWTQIINMSPEKKRNYHDFVAPIYKSSHTPYFDSSLCTSTADPGCNSCIAPEPAPQTNFQEQIPCSSSPSAEIFNSPAMSRVYPNSRCDSSGDGHSCNNGYCYRSYDCISLPSDPLCPPPVILPPPPPAGTPATSDSFTSWFHRPHPPGGATYEDSAGRTLVTGSIGGSSRLCINKNWRAVRGGPRGDRGRYTEIDLGIFGTLHFFYYDLFEPSLSPGVCGMGSAGHRGTGYIYLKGAQGLLYNDLDDDTMYYEGEIGTRFEGDNATHAIRICTRFRNTICVQCEGKRECVPTAGSTLITSMWTQACGHDFCETFRVSVGPDVPGGDREKKGQECMFDTGDASMNSDCSETFDTYLRMRAVYHEGNNQDYICGYLDAKGHLGYDPDLIRPNNHGENIDHRDNTTPCRAKFGVVPDDNGVYDCGGGFDEGSRSYEEGWAHKWRNVLKADYVTNNQGGGPLSGRGYYDANDRFHYNTTCAPVRRRVGSIFYNVATAANSPTILNPPVYIHSVISRDFYRPEVRVHYGLIPIVTYADGLSGTGGPSYSCYSGTNNDGSPCRNNSRLRASFLHGHNQIYLSLNPDELDGEMEFQTAAASNSGLRKNGGRDGAPSYSYIDSEIPSVGERVNTELFLRKSYDYSTGRPTFCLYQKTKDADGTYSENPLKVSCRDREEPYGTLHMSWTGNRSTMYLTSPDYLDPTSRIRTNTAILNVANINTNYCSAAIQSYNFCMRRDQCTKLAIECPQAAVDRSGAVLTGKNPASYDAIISNCENVIKPACLELRGLDPDSTSPDLDIVETNDYGAFRCRNNDSLYLEGVLCDPSSPSRSRDCDLRPCEVGQDPFRYGWYSENYISVGFPGFFYNKVKAHRTLDGSIGICKVTNSSPNLSDYVVDPNSPSGEILIDANGNQVPDMTTHCLGGGTIDPLSPCVCETVSNDYVLSAEEAQHFYIRDPTPREAGASSEIPFSAMCSARPGSSNNPPTGEDFSAVYVGVSAVGTCDASNHWIERRDLTGNNVFPAIDCITDDSPSAIPGTGILDDDSLRNSCIRRTCNQILAGNPNPLGEYLGDYDVGETGECKGYRNGFANWSPYTPDPDISPSNYISFAASCIPGFRPLGSTAVVENGLISSYSGGNLPQRICNLTGHFGSLTDESIDSSITSCGNPPASAASVTQARGCQRISCPAISPPIPTGIGDTAAWAQWFENEGASFVQVNASRSVSQIYDESKSFGTCNTSLGFAQAPGGTQPYYECDSFGNKGPIINPCIEISCSEVDADSDNLNHGFAKWSEVTDADMINAINSAALASSSSSSQPQSAAIERDYNGICHTGYVTNPYIPITDIQGNPLYTSAQDYLILPAQPPKRYCIGGYDSSGNIIKIWRSVHNPCINKCPGGKDDFGVIAADMRIEIMTLESNSSRTSAQERRLQLLRTELASLDDRLGIGKTNHSVSNARTGNTSSLDVHWPSANLGETVYLSNSDPSQIDASDFIESGNHEKYILRRVCGNDGRWEDPMPSCSANGGMINGAVIDVTGATGHANSVRSYTDAERQVSSSTPSFENIFGQCNNLDTVISDSNVRAMAIEAISRLSNSEPNLWCRRDPSGNINEVYYVLHDTNSTFCHSCPPIANQEIDVNGFANPPIIASSDNRRHYPRESYTASCNANHNYSLISSTIPLANPSVVCDPDGTGQWIADTTNINNCKRSCLIGSSFLQSSNLNTSSSICPSNITFSMSGESSISSSDGVQIKHGERFEFNAYNSCNISYEADFGGGNNASSICKIWRYSALCLDGNVSINQDVQTSYNGCNYYEYNYNAGSWSNPILMPISSNPQFVSYLHLQRSPSLSSGLGMMATDNDFTDISVNCTSGCPDPVVRSRGIVPGNIAAAAASGVVSFDWDALDVDLPSVYNPSVGSSRTFNCFDHVYNGSHPISSFSTSSCSSSGCSPGSTITGSCRSGAILVGKSPSITCSSSGVWTISNDDNCLSNAFDYSMLAGLPRANAFVDSIPNGSFNPISGMVQESFNNNANTNGDGPGTSNCQSSNPPTAPAGSIIARSFTIDAGKRALIIVDLHGVDNEFDIKINGVRIYGTDGVCGSIEAATGHHTTNDTRIEVSNPWSSNSNVDPNDPTGNNLPRVRVLLNDRQAHFFKTNSSSDRNLARVIPSINTFNVPQILSGNHEIQIINYDGPGPDGMNGRIYIYQVPNTP